MVSRYTLNKLLSVEITISDLVYWDWYSYILSSSGVTLGASQSYKNGKHAVVAFHSSGFNEASPDEATTCWCYYCNQCFDSESSLVQHMQCHSHSERPFKCVKCDLTFMHKGTLKRHEKVCAGSHRVKSHSCDLCHKSFTYRHDLRRHQRTVHREFHS